MMNQRVKTKYGAWLSCSHQTNTPTENAGKYIFKKELPKGTRKGINQEEIERESTFGRRYQKVSFLLLKELKQVPISNES